MVEAIAKAAGVPGAEVRRAMMLRGALGPVAEAALAGVPALREFHLQVGRPLQPMLASTAPSVEAAMERVGEAAVEWKLDGARVQVHRDGGEVAVYTRTMDDITARVPEVVAAPWPCRCARPCSTARSSPCTRRPAAPVPGHGQPGRQPPRGRAPRRRPAAHRVPVRPAPPGRPGPAGPAGGERHAALAAAVPEPLRIPGPSPPTRRRPPPSWPTPWPGATRA